MANHVATLLEAIQWADPGYGRRTLEPVQPGEHIIGVLPESGRRIHSELIRQHELMGRHMQEKRRIQSDPVLYNDDKVISAWISESRLVRARIAALEALTTLAIYAAFPEAIIRDNIMIRQDYVVVWSEQPQKKDTEIDAATAIITSDAMPEEES